MAMAFKLAFFLVCSVFFNSSVARLHSLHASAATTLLPYHEFLKIKTDGSSSTSSCPCSDAALCENVRVTHDKELFGFAGKSAFSSNASIYNWTYLTTIAWAPTNATELLCEAHSHNVRLVTSTGNVPLTFNATERAIWIKQMFEQVEYYHFDGVTFDVESLLSSQQSQQYTLLVNETTNYFHANMPGSQISVCVAWQSFDTDGRQYDYAQLAQSSDLLYVMDYDTNSQNFQHQCIASANAPYFGTQRGIQSYLNLGIDPNKLVLGIPWYGYNYRCDMAQMESMQSKYCPIELVPFRGVNCSDAAGSEFSFAKIQHIIDMQWNITEIRWDTSMLAPYFNYIDSASNASQVFQIWFDNPQSLRLKYEYAKSQKIRGVGPFTLLDLNDVSTPAEMQRAQEMWAAFDSFFV